MHQLDVLISAKQAEWERKESALRDLLQTRERDLSGLRLAMQEREKEVCVRARVRVCVCVRVCARTRMCVVCMQLKWWEGVIDVLCLVSSPNIWV